jgi:uncharacterized membrane protein
MTTLSRLLALLGILSTGAVAGLFYAYWCSVMIALDRLRPEAAIKTMQTINVAIINPLFFATFMGTLAILPLAALAAWWSGASASAGWLAAAFLVYAVGTFGVTVAFNVPLNDALERLKDAPADPAADWQAFVEPWNRWNTVRMAAGFVATALAAMALLADGRS